METIQNLNEKQGRTICLITHEAYVAGYAGRTITLKDGQVVKDITVHERHKKGDRYTK